MQKHHEETIRKMAEEIILKIDGGRRDQMSFQEACASVVLQAQQENRLIYLYKGCGNYSWFASHQYWHDWLFKAYPGGRKVLSVEGTMQSEKAVEHTLAVRRLI